jgi:hypothetical protein
LPMRERDLDEKPAIFPKTPQPAVRH